MNTAQRPANIGHPFSTRHPRPDVIPAKAGIHAIILAKARKQSSNLTAIILALFVVLPTTISVWVDGQIKNYQERLLTLEIRRSDYIQLSAHHQGRINAFEILGALIAIAPKLGLIPSASADTISKIDPEGQELLAQHQSGQITITQYMQEMGNLDRRKKQYYADRIEQVGNEITSLHSRPPSAFAIKKFLPIAQMVGVILVIFVNVRNLGRANAQTYPPSHI